MVGDTPRCSSLRLEDGGGPEAILAVSEDVAAAVKVSNVEDVTSVVEGPDVPLGTKPSPLYSKESHSTVFCSSDDRILPILVLELGSARALQSSGARINHKLQ